MKKNERKEFIKFLELEYPNAIVKPRMGNLSHSFKKKLIEEYRRQRKNSELKF